MDVVNKTATQTTVTAEALCHAKLAYVRWPKREAIALRPSYVQGESKPHTELQESKVSYSFGAPIIAWIGTVAVLAVDMSVALAVSLCRKPFTPISIEPC